MTNSNAIVSVDTSVGNTSLIAAFDYEKAVSEVTPEQRAQYSSLTRDIRIDSPHSIQSYAQDINKIIAKQADELLSKAKADRTSEAVTLANDLLSEIYNVENPNEEPTAKSWLKSLPIIGSFVKDVEKASIKHNTIGHNVEEISKKFESLKVIAMSDNAALETMGENTATYIYELRERIVALMILKEDLEKEVAELEAAEYCDLDILQQKRNALSAMSKRVTNMVSTEAILKQNMHQIAGMLGNNDAIIEKADMTIGQVIPIWKQQLALTTMLDNQQAGAEIERKMADAANKMLVANAQKMNRNSIEIARQSEESFWKIETMRDTKNIMIDTVKQIKNIHDNGEANRVKLLAEMKNISDEYAHALLEAK